MTIFTNQRNNSSISSNRGSKVGSDNKIDKNIDDDSNADNDDVVLIAQSDALRQEERLLAAARLLQQVKNTGLLQPKHVEILEQARDCQTALKELIAPPDSTWIKQGESSGKYDALVYYKVDDQARLTGRIESVISSTLLVPLLSVLNEVNLFKTWIPSWTFPTKIGVRETKRLTSLSRASQLLYILTDVPWPYAPREAYLQALAIDEIESNNINGSDNSSSSSSDSEAGYIAVRLTSLHDDGGKFVQPVDPAIDRADFEGALLFRACPLDHVLLQKYQKRRQQQEQQSLQNNDSNSATSVVSEPMILVSFSMFQDAHLAGIPTNLINFVTRTVIGRVWDMLLTVAQGVRDGTQPQHQAAIAANHDFYSWMDQRVQVMLSQLQDIEERKRNQQTKNEQTSALGIHDFELVMYLQS